MGRRWPTTGSEALNTSGLEKVILKEVTITVLPPTIVWPQAKQQGGNIASPINKHWIKDLLSMAPPIRTRPRFWHSQSLPSGISISLLSVSIRGLMCYNEHKMWLKVHWKSNLLPPWTLLVLTSFCHVLWLCFF